MTDERAMEVLDRELKMMHDIGLTGARAHACAAQRMRYHEAVAGEARIWAYAADIIDGEPTGPDESITIDYDSTGADAAGFVA